MCKEKENEKEKVMVADNTSFDMALSQPADEPNVDNRLLNTIFAEVGSAVPEETDAVISAFLNRIDKYGIKKALKGSSAYKFKSPQYMKAQAQDFNVFEQRVYDKIKGRISALQKNKKARLPYTHFENIKAFGEPSWAKDAVAVKDIGRQRFYILNK